MQARAVCLRLAIWVLAGLTMAAPFQSPAGDYADKVVIILDASGSMDAPMGGQKSGAIVKKMDAAKKALKNVLTGIPESTHVGLLVFSGRNVSDPWAYPLGPRDNAAFAMAIDLPQPGGNTPLGKFIKIGADRLLEERAKDFGYGSYRLLVVTDGEATDGSLTDRYTPEIIARGITMDVIGVNMKTDHTLATKVHSYRRADDQKSLQKALSEILGEVSGTGSDAAAAEAFELLAPLPVELCGSMLQALQMNNQPISGKKEAPQPQAQPQSRQGRAKGAKPAPAQPEPEKKEDGGFPWAWVVVAVICWAVMKNAADARRKKRR